MSSSTLTLYENYYANAALVKADFEWENGSTDMISYKEGSSSEDTMAPGTIKGQPAFEDGVLEGIGLPPFKKWRREGGTMVAQSKNWSAIIPGGFRGAATPNKMNPISFDIGGYSALMGLVHVIVIPDKRITNCVTVTEEDIPLIEEGVQLLHTAFDLLVKGHADEIGSVRWQLSQADMVTMKDGSEKSTNITEEDFIDENRENFKNLRENTQQALQDMKMEVTCHGDTMSSIRKLHIHGFSSDYKTIAWQKMEEWAEQEFGLLKNTPINEILDMATSGKVKEMKDRVLMPPPQTTQTTQATQTTQTTQATQTTQTPHYWCEKEECLESTHAYTNQHDLDTHYHEEHDV